MTDFEILKKISECPGVPGYEQAIRKMIIEEITDLVDEVYVDSMGSVIGKRLGKESKAVMVTAHMDEIGFMVSHIDDQGFIKFQPLGGFDPKTLTSQRVVVHGREDVIGVMGTKPIHIMSPEDRNKAPKIEDYFIDTGLKAEDVKARIRVGDTITRERELILMGDCYNGKSLDNRVSVFILIQCLKALKEEDLPYDVYAVFTVQEEVGLRGAINAAGHIDPAFGLNLDVTIAYDVPGSQPHENVTQLGKGTAIKILDGSVICDYRMVSFLKETADANEIKWQNEILPAGGTDAAAIQRFGKMGAITGGISIPLRNMHQVIETVHVEDVNASIDLLKQALTKLDQYNWSFV